MFRVTYVCTNDRVCSLTLVPLDAVYEQDLITDQFLYSKPYPNGFVKTTIRWFADSQSKAALASEKELDERNLISCTNNQCTLNSNPTGLRFDGNATHATVYVKGEASINNKIYPVNLSTKIKFNNLGAPTIAKDGVCSSAYPNCHFKVTKDPKGGYSPLYYKWLLNNKQIAQTRSDDDNKGKLNYRFKSFSHNMILQMVAVDKYGDQSPPSNKVNISSLRVSIEGETHVSTSSEYTYRAIVKGDGPAIEATGFRWYLPKGWHVKSGTPANLKEIKVVTSSNILTSAVIRVSAKDIKGGEGESAPFHVTMRDGSLGPKGGVVEPDSDSVTVGSTVLYTASGFKVEGGSSTYRLLNLMKGDISGAIDANGYKWAMDEKKYGKDFSLGTSSTNQVSVTVLNSKLTSIPTDAIWVEASDIGKDKKRHYSRDVHPDKAVAIIGGKVGPTGGKIVPESTVVPVGGEVTFDAKDFVVQKGHKLNLKGYQWRIAPMYANYFSFVNSKNTSDKVRVRVEKKATKLSEIPAGSIGVVAHDKKGNPSHLVLLDKPIKITKILLKANVKLKGSSIIAYNSINSQSIRYQVNASGGQKPYRYDIDKFSIKVKHPDITAVTVNNAGQVSLTVKAGASADAINPGDIKVGVKDSFGTIVSGHPTQVVTIKGRGGIPTVSVALNGSNVIPYNYINSQSIRYQIKVSGGQKPYRYDIDKFSIKVKHPDITAVTVNNAGQVSLTVKAGASADAINPGDIKVGVKDSFGTIVSGHPTQVVTIKGRGGIPTVSVALNGSNVIPYNSINSQSIRYQIKVSGGQKPYRYDIDKFSIKVKHPDITAVTVNNAGQVSLTVKAGASADAINPGDIKVGVKDSFGTIVSGHPTQVVTIKGRGGIPTVSVTLNGSNVIPYNSINSQSIRYQIKVSGGQKPYRYDIDKFSIKVKHPDITAVTVNNAGQVSLTVKAGASADAINPGDIKVGVKDSFGTIVSGCPTQDVIINGSSVAPKFTVSGPATVKYGTTLFTYKVTTPDTADKFDWSKAIQTLKGLNYVQDAVVSPTNAKELDVTLDVSKIPPRGDSIDGSKISVTGTNTQGSTTTNATSAVKINGSNSVPKVSVEINPTNGIVLYVAGSTKTLIYTAISKTGKAYKWAVPTSISQAKGIISVTGENANTLELKIDDTDIAASGLKINKGDITVIATDDKGVKSKPTAAPAATINGSNSAPEIKSVKPKASSIPYSSSPQVFTYHVDATAKGGATISSYQWTVRNLPSGIKPEITDSATLKLNVPAGVTKNAKISKNDISVKVVDSNGNIIEKNADSDVMILALPAIKLLSVHGGPWHWIGVGFDKFKVHIENVKAGDEISLQYENVHTGVTGLADKNAALTLTKDSESEDYYFWNLNKDGYGYSKGASCSNPSYYIYAQIKRGTETWTSKKYKLSIAIKSRSGRNIYLNVYTSSHIFAFEDFAQIYQKYLRISQYSC
ncbi:hypothetical protein AB8E56_10875 [Francisella sp. 19X1-34]|nr:hypothetical protein [Francisella sp. 19X1-34]